MLKWQAVFDPNEVKDYARDWTNEMNAFNDELNSVDFNLKTPNSGLSVQSNNIDATGKIAIAWFAASDIPLLTSFAGQVIEIDHTITTVGGRTYNETLGLRIKEK